MKTILSFPMNILRSILGTISQLLTFISNQVISFIASLQRPMATSIRSTRGFIISLLVGLFVAIVGVGMQPFGLEYFQHPSKTLYLLSFGLVAFTGMLIAKFILPALLNKFYNEQQWTVGKQIIHFSIITLLLCALLVAYSNFFNIISFKISNIVNVLFISILPIVITTFIQQKIFHNKFVSSAEAINSGLNSLSVPQSKQILPVLVFGEKEQKLSLLPNQLIYAETSAKSTTLYWQNFMGIEKTTINASLAKVEKELAAHPQFIRLHRNFVVNVRGIQKVEGNARGYQLHVSRTSQEIPVSWKFHKKLEQIRA